MHLFTSSIALYTRIISFYNATRGIKYLETAEIQRSGRNPKANNRLELQLEMTPVGIVNIVKTLQQLREAMYCIVHCVHAVHERGWSIVDLRWPNIVAVKGIFYVIDSGEFAQRHGNPIHSDRLKLRDLRSVSCSCATDTYMLVTMMDELSDLWHGNMNGRSFYEALNKCYQENSSLASVLDNRFLSKP